MLRWCLQIARVFHLHLYPHPLASPVDRQSRERVWRRLLGDLYSLPHSKHKGEKYKRNTKRAALHHAASVKRSSLATSQSSDLSQSMSSHHLSHSYGDPMGASTPSLSRSVNSRGRSRLKPNGTAAPDIMHRLDTEDSLAAPVAVPGAVSQSTSRLNQQVEVCCHRPADLCVRLPKNHAPGQSCSIRTPVPR